MWFDPSVLQLPHMYVYNVLVGSKSLVFFPFDLHHDVVDSLIPMHGDPPLANWPTLHRAGSERALRRRPKGCREGNNSSLLGQEVISPCIIGVSDIGSPESRSRGQKDEININSFLRPFSFFQSLGNFRLSHVVFFLFFS